MSDGSLGYISSIDGLKIDTGEAIAMALVHFGKCDLYKLCDEPVGKENSR